MGSTLSLTLTVILWHVLKDANFITGGHILGEISIVLNSVKRSKPSLLPHKVLPLAKILGNNSFESVILHS
jgi:hypothetical protein